MARAPGLDLDRNFDLVQMQFRVRSQMLDPEDVRIGGRELGQQPSKRTRPVGNPQPEGQIAASGRHAVA